MWPAEDLPLQIYFSYLDRRKADHLALSEALQYDRLEAFNRIGHQLMGNARSFGFLDLEKIGEKFEGLKKEQLKSEGPILLDEFARWITITEKVLAKKSS